MKSKIRIVIIVGIILIFARVYAIVDVNKPIYDKKIDNSEYSTFQLSEGDVISQRFVVEEKKINGVEVKIAVNGNQESAEVHYCLMNESKNVVDEGDLSLKELKNGRFFEFRTDSVTECQGQEYTFELGFKGCDDETSVTAYVVPDTSVSPMKLNNKDESGCLALRTITRRFNLETFIVTLLFAVYVVVFMRWLAKIFKG